MNIYIVSKDERYYYLNELLRKDGHNSKITEPKSLENAKVVIFSVRDELSEAEYKTVLSSLEKDTLVLCGNEKTIKEYFNGRVISYSKNEDFLLKNAYLTSEAFLSIWQEKTKESFFGKNVLIVGYGRIGRCLSKMLSCLGANVNIYARRSEVRKKVKTDGFKSVTLDILDAYDAIINTAPDLVFNEESMGKISTNTLLFDLASKSGFYDEKRVTLARGLPGKILPKSAGHVIYDTIKEHLF